VKPPYKKKKNTNRPQDRHKGNCTSLTGLIDGRGMQSAIREKKTCKTQKKRRGQKPERHHTQKAEERKQNRLEQKNSK